MSADLEREKRLAAEAAARLVEDGMTVGLGTGSTASLFVDALARRAPDIRCVATSPETEARARAGGLPVEPFTGRHALPRLDLAVDGADQVAPDLWVVKGGGGAHTREKIVASAAARFVVVISSDKLVERLRAPIPLELMAYGLAATCERLGAVRLRGASVTPDGGVLADWEGDVDDPARLAALLSSTAGVVEHGLFPPALVSEVVVGDGDGVRRLPP